MKKIKPKSEKIFNKCNNVFKETVLFWAYSNGRSIFLFQHFWS